ncbi:unnamed protein product [Meganyctiphanes norvegica]|uniref:Uncharacterized protein n=1 Tax=Meganyctiphanes norvegica TaxID=48144 RepID=A0AAV2Q6N8_MEGNR
MRLLICLLLVGVVSCTSMLKDLPPNADIKYMYKNSKLVGIKIDYKDNLQPVVKSAAKKVGASKTFYKIDDGELEQLNPTHVKYNTLPKTSAAPIIKSAPIPAAPKPVTKTAGSSKTFFKVDDGELERVNPTHVRYSTLPESPAAPVFKSAPVPIAPAPVASAPAPVAAAEPLIIAGPQVVLRQAPAPTARSVIIRGPQVIYKRGPAPVSAPTLAPVPVAKSAPAAPAPAPSPLIKSFYKKDDGELEKINPTHVSYSFVKSAPAAVAIPVVAPAPVPVAAPAPVVYWAPTPVVKATPLVEESVEEEDDD